MFKSLNIWVRVILLGLLAFPTFIIAGQPSPAQATATIESYTTVTNTTWTVPAGVYNVTYLVVGGGGGGGGFGGGGAGGYLAGWEAVTPGASLTLVVGNKGTGSGAAAGQGNSGSASVFDTKIAAGGGGGGAFSDTYRDGKAGGSGGGAGTQATGSYLSGAVGAGNSPTTTPSQGSNGGLGATGATAAGGGGGSASVGAGATTNTGGAGGTGTSNSITGSAVWYAAGGGGGGYATYGAGGSTGAGHGQQVTPTPAAATSAGSNTGSGGGGAYAGAANGDGGTGIVVLSYLIQPTVTTQAVSNITVTSVTGNGNITSLNGGASATRRGMCYMTGTSGDPTVSNSTAYSDGTFSAGTFTQNIASLSSSTNYRVRAYAVNEGGTSYGTTVQTQTYGTTPLVTTSAASSITTVGASLNGGITWCGGDATCSARGFQYDVDSGAPYATNTTSTSSYGTGTYSNSILSLSKGTLYYFRAFATNSVTTGYGSELTFLTLPDPPTGFVATRGSTEITLNWSNGSGAGNTMIRRSTTGYPTTTATGTQVYLNTGITYTDTGLTDGTTYYYSAWSEKTSGGITQYSSTYIYASTNPGTGTILAPDTLEITSASVFTGFRTTGDQLYVFTYKCIYTAGDPAYTAGDFFNIQLLDGDVLKAQIKMPYWGYKPASIYMAPGSGLVWGSSYKIKVIGTTSQWTVQPYSSYSLQTYDWKGAGLTQLDTWIIDSAGLLGAYYSTTYTQSVPGYGTILSTTGGTLFETAIGGLSVYRPLLFETGVKPLVVDTTPVTDVYGASRSLTTTFGAEAAGQIATFSAFFGQTSQTVAGWIVVLFAMLLAVVLGMASGNMGVGAFAGLFIVVVGVVLGAPAMAPVWAIGSVFVIIFFFSLARGI